MRIALAQINPTVGDIPGNTALIKDAIQQAKAQDARLVVCPELAIIGYPPKDLLLKPALVDQCKAAAESLAQACRGITAVIGLPVRSGHAAGRTLHNAAAICQGGQITGYRAHLTIAGGDGFIMPSRFEPCGLGQMYAMIYGSVPVVRATGGLIDTVVPYDEHRSTGTGFVFEHPTREALYYTIGWACATYYDRPAAFRQLQLNGMRGDYSWDASAEKYEAVYGWARQARGAAFF